VLPKYPGLKKNNKTKQNFTASEKSLVNQKAEELESS